MKTKFTILILLFLLSGCKPKEIIKERFVKEIDSAEIIHLRSQLEEKKKEAESLKAEINRFREENVRLQNEMTSHTINYNTDAPLKPDGSYPIASETRTESKSVMESKMLEYERIISDYEGKFESQNNTISELTNEVEYLEKINSELQSKTVPQSGTKFRLIVIAFVIGLVIPTVFFLRNKIKSFRLWKR